MALPNTITLIFCVHRPYGKLSTVRPINDLTSSVLNCATCPRIHVSDPSSRTDILSFFLRNYVAHAATVVIYPGESFLSTIGAVILAFFFPTSGIVRGLTAIVRHAATQSKPLEQAARAGALCMVVRNADWRPQADDRLNDMVWRGEMTRKKRKSYNIAGFWFKKQDSVEFADVNSVKAAAQLSFHVFRPPWVFEMCPTWMFIDTGDVFVSKSKMIHGFYNLTDEYTLAHVPRDAIVVPTTSPLEVPKRCIISANYSVIKAFVAVIQLSFAYLTLYHSSDTEIADNGYGAYSLTIIQYALMSFVNLVGILFNPSYPALYLVGSEVMDEAIRRGSMFDGVVGRLVSESIEIVGIDTHKISGIFKQQQSSAEANGIPAEARERRPITNGNGSYVYDSSERTIWTGESDRYDPTLTFIPDVKSDTEIFAQMGTLLRTCQQNFLQHSINQQKTAAFFASTPQSYSLDASAFRNPNRSSLFVPVCPNFQRRNHSSYNVHFDRLIQTPDSLYHFYGHGANQTLLWGGYILQFSSLIFGAMAIAIIGALSRFRDGESTYVERVVFMTWLAVGLYVGSGTHNILGWVRKGHAYLLVGVPLYFLPAAVGLYEVVAVMSRYGTCIRIS
ncbi:hypothetical protein MMC17_000122 [Xylographa soralifera]|nr:hypothetical protein [Xylographa soralifera]